MPIRVPLVLAALLALSACDRGETPPTPDPAQPPTPKVEAAQAATVVRVTDPAILARGRQVFAQNCAQCHGAQAQGAPNWQRRAADGRYPPPPLNGTGHAWHHPTAALEQVIKEGTIKIGGNMPPWKDKLSDEDIEAVIAWFQSLWPQEIYEAWARMERSTRSP